ncbi:uncharacterized [Tachysurus ichikawai]
MELSRGALVAKLRVSWKKKTRKAQDLASTVCDSDPESPEQLKCTVKDVIPSQYIMVVIWLDNLIQNQHSTLQFCVSTPYVGDRQCAGTHAAGEDPGLT